MASIRTTLATKRNWKFLLATIPSLATTNGLYKREARIGLVAGMRRRSWRMAKNLWSRPTDCLYSLDKTKQDRPKYLFHEHRTHTDFVRPQHLPSQSQNEQFSCDRFKLAMHYADMKNGVFCKLLKKATSVSKNYRASNGTGSSTGGVCTWYFGKWSRHIVADEDWNGIHSESKLSTLLLCWRDRFVWNVTEETLWYMRFPCLQVLSLRNLAGSYQHCNGTCFFHFLGRN